MSESLEDVYNIYKADETWELGSIPAAVWSTLTEHRLVIEPTWKKTSTEGRRQ